MNTFVHLRQYSNYSLLESSFKINEIIDLCKEHKMPAISLTDKQNLFGAFEFSLEAKKNGIQPILGINLEIKKLGDLENPSSILLLIKNNCGYKNVINIMTNYYNNEENNINFNDLEKNSDGIICLSGNIDGPISQLALLNNTASAEKTLIKLNSIYKDNFFIELTRSDNGKERKIENFLLSLANKHNVPVVATNNNHFSNKSMHEATDALLCIKNVDKLSNSTWVRFS